MLDHFHHSPPALDRGSTLSGNDLAVMCRDEGRPRQVGSPEVNACVDGRRKEP